MNEDVSPRKKLGDFPSSNRHVSFPWILRVFETPHPGLLIFHPVNQAPRHPLEGAGIHINSPNQYIYIYIHPGSRCHHFKMVVYIFG